MIYPQDFKNRVLKAYPNSPEVKKLLKPQTEENFVKLSHFLRDNSSTKISIDVILEATSLEELQEKARLENEKYRLYFDSLAIFYSRFSSINNSSENG